MEDIPQQKILRVFKLIRLLSTKPYKTISGLATSLGVDERTIRRYIELLEDIGYMIDQNVERKTYYIFEEVEAPVSDYPTLFNEEETVILTQLLELSTIPPDKRSQLGYKMFVNSTLKEIPQLLISQHQAQIAASVREAIQKEYQIKLISYYSAHSDTTTDRTVEPLSLDSQYFEAYEPKSKKVKKFKLERVKKIRVLDKKRTYKGDGLKEDIFKMSGDAPIAVHLKLSNFAYYLLIEEFPTAKNNIHTLQNERYEYKGIVYDFRGIGRFILGIPGEIEIISPLELREYVKDKSNFFKDL